MEVVAIVIRSCRIPVHNQTMTHYSFDKVSYHRFREPFPEGHHHRRVKWRQLLKAFQANGELEVRVFFDLLNESFIRETQAGFDDQSFQCYRKWLGRSIKPLAELG